ncbi:hypothetical protein C4556_02480 [Candidatus Parcubacteria bacterium]|nr:MAG: hypothetical protein C4556_02480 [Candidatus Parcubacteria bacterium]
MRYERSAIFIAFLVFAMLSVSSPATLDAAENPELCNQLFGLPEGTIQMDADKRIMNPEVCEAYAFLISRYNPGPRSSVGLSNPKVEGITKLNPDFALALAKMLRAAPPMGINSAYRTPAGQGSKNPQSNHIYGCAADLGYSQGGCGSAHCQWVLRNAPSYGIHIRMKYSPEWNHVEPIAKDACRNNGPGVGAPVANAPSSGLADSIRQSVGLGGSQNCTLPDGLVVPCSAIANQGAAPAGSQSPTGAAIPRQTLPASQQPFQYLPSPTPVSNIVQPPVPQIPVSTTSSTTTLTTFERIMRFAEATRVSSPAATSAPLVLTASIRDIATIQPDTSSITPLQENGTHQYLPVPSARLDTFTSPDLGGGISPNVSQEVTGYQKVLADMQTTLLRALEYLRPFGRPLEPAEDYAHDDWSE